MSLVSAVAGVALAVITQSSSKVSQADLVAKLPAHTRILFQGDSITDMNRGRNADPNHLLGHSYAFIIGAKAAATFPLDGVEFVNRGVSGDKVTDLSARWQQDTLDVKPDVLSILIGVNDLNSGVSALDYETGYDRLLERTRTALPTVKFVLCEPFGLPTGNAKDKWDSYSKDLAERRAIVSRLASKYGAVLVHFQAALDSACKRAPVEHWVWDGIHPTFAGQQVIADEWVKTVNHAFADPLFDPAQNCAIDPSVNIERDSYDWLHRHDDVLQTQAAGNPDVVMIGDSITHFWGGLPKDQRQNGPKAWEATFRGLRVLNMGFGWDRTQNVLWRLGHGEFEGLDPKTVVVNIGTNNLVGDSTARTNTPEETATGIVAVVRVIQLRAPNCHVYVMAVFPRGFEKGNELDARIQKLNLTLAQSLKGLVGVTFLDIRTQLCEPDGSINAATFFDGTHPTEKGYDIWGRALRVAGAIPPGSSK